MTLTSHPTVARICSWIESVAPVYLAEPWDRVGLQTGKRSEKVRKVMTALTLTHHVVDQAVEVGANMIVVHHPVIFKPLTEIAPDSRVGALITRLIEEKLALYAAHTNFDAALFGVNDGLAERLQLENVTSFTGVSVRQDIKPDDERSEGARHPGIGRIGHLSKPMSGEEFTEYVMQQLSLPNVRVVGGPGKRISRVAIVGGSGGSFVSDAYERGADALVTGDVDFHDADEALFYQLMVIDAGHFGTEKHVPKDIAHLINKQREREQLCLEVVVAEELDPFTVISGG